MAGKKKTATNKITTKDKIMEKYGVNDELRLNIDDYKELLKETPTMIKQYPVKDRRLYAIAYYLSNPTKSIRWVGEILDIPEGTVIRWSKQDKWNEKRKEDEKIKKLLLRAEIIEEDMTEYHTIFKNYLQRLMLASLEPRPIESMKDEKALAEIVNGLLDKLQSLPDMNIKESNKVELQGQITADFHSISVGDMEELEDELPDRPEDGDEDEE